MTLIAAWTHRNILHVQCKEHVQPGFPWPPSQRRADTSSLLLQEVLESVGMWLQTHRACLPSNVSSRPLNRTRLRGRGEALERECASLSQQCKHMCARTVYRSLGWVCSSNTCRVSVFCSTKTLLSCRFRILWLTLCQLHNAMEIEVV